MLNYVEGSMEPTTNASSGKMTLFGVRLSVIEHRTDAHRKGRLPTVVSGAR